MEDDERKLLVDEYRLTNELELVPVWQRLPFISHFYRVHFSLPLAAASFFRLHNESVNVWTHAVSAVVAAYSMIVCAPAESRWIWLASGSFVCAGFIASTVFHLFNCSTYRRALRVLRCDYGGIVAITTSLYFVPLYYSFYCFPTLQRLYIAMLLTLAISIIALSQTPTFHSPRFDHARIAAFSGLALSGLIPIAHLRIFLSPYALDTGGHAAITRRLLCMYATFGAGVFIYVKKIPEHFSGLSHTRLTALFSSHAVWHLIVSYAVYYHHQTSLMVLAEWKRRGSCAAHWSSQLLADGAEWPAY